MGALWHDDRLLKRALIASLVLHLIFAYFIPSLTQFQGIGPTIETISFVKMVRLTIQHPQPVVNVRVAEAPKHAQVVSITKDAHSSGLHPTPSKTASITSKQNSAQTTSDTTQSGVAVAQPGSQPSATPASDQPQVASNETRQQTGGIMPFGAEDPVPVLGDSASIIAQLRTLGVHVKLTIVVGEDAKIRSIHFNPELSSSLEDSIRGILASARWDAAYCGGGIPCEGTAIITL